MDSPLNGKVRNEGTTSTLIMDPVSFKDEHQYLCTAICKDKKLEKAIRVEIYCEYFSQYLIFSPFCFKISFLKESVQSLSHVQLFDCMDCSTPGVPVHHQLAQTHLH